MILLYGRRGGRTRWLPGRTSSTPAKSRGLGICSRAGEFDLRKLAKVGNLMARADFFWLPYHINAG